MQLKITINLDNDAIINDNDLPRILHDIAENINDWWTDLENWFSRPISDINGNNVGFITIE